MAARSTFIVAWADEHGKTLSEALEQWEGRDREIAVISAYRSWRARRERELQEEERRKAEAKQPRH